MSGFCRGLLIVASLVAGCSGTHAQTGKPITPEQVRPPSDALIDCRGAPKAAVLKPPGDLARWATVYCTKVGHIFSPNDKYFAAFPGSGVRGSVSAASFSGRKGEIGHAAYFTKISYKQLSSAAVSQLSAEASPVVSGLLKGKDVFRVDLTIDTGQVVSMAAIGPSNEIFWVFPLVNNKLGPAGFYVASLDYVNRKR